jgi:ATP-dependent DNA ligase
MDIAIPKVRGQAYALKLQIDGEAMFRHACAMGLEGIVSKKLMAR